jgi:hypothetical protein
VYKGKLFRFIYSTSLKILVIFGARKGQFYHFTSCTEERKYLNLKRNWVGPTHQSETSLSPRQPGPLISRPHHPLALGATPTCRHCRTNAGGGAHELPFTEATRSRPPHRRAAFRLAGENPPPPLVVVSPSTKSVRPVPSFVWDDRSAKTSPP